jgi:hypothetical protein
VFLLHSLKILHNFKIKIFMAIKKSAPAKKAAPGKTSNSKKTTSPEAAHAASEVLQDDPTGKNSKTAAGSALSQKVAGKKKK